MSSRKTFPQMMDESLGKNPFCGVYLHLCTCIQESGMSKQEVTKWFDKYMTPKEDYDKPEKGELVDYLFKLASEVPE